MAQAPQFLQGKEKTVDKDGEKDSSAGEDPLEYEERTTYTRIVDSLPFYPFQQAETNIIQEMMRNTGIVDYFESIVQARKERLAHIQGLSKEAYAADLRNRRPEFFEVYDDV